MARYRLVGVLPLRLTPTRITSAPARSWWVWPSSCARLKLMASMRSWYSLLLLMSENRPTRWCDLMPSSTSSGCTKVPNMSSSMPLQPSWMTLSTSMFTRVVKTMHLRPSSSAVWLIWRTAWCALSTVSMKGRRTCRGTISNCARMALPKVSAVMPVPSETKNTVRVCMRGLMEYVSPLPEARAYNCAHYPNSHHARCRPTSTTTKPSPAPGCSPTAPPGHGRRPGFNFWSFPMSTMFPPTELVVTLAKIRKTDVKSVGGKNASLGEMTSQLPEGVRVPTGFATTAHAFREFLAYDGLADKISAKLAALDTEDVRALAQVGAEIRAMVEAQPFQADLEQAIRDEFARLSAGNPHASFAVRSSATAEDLPDASFAG